MSVEFLRNLSLGSYVAAIVFGVVSITLFFVLRIPAVIGDLTGITARKAIEDIRMQNAGAYQPRRKSTRSERGKRKAESRAENVQSIQRAGETEDLSASNLAAYARERSISEETTLLSQAGETTVLTGETTPLSSLEEASPAFHVDVDFGFTASAETID